MRLTAFYYAVLMALSAGTTTAQELFNPPSRNQPTTIRDSAIGFSNGSIVAAPIPLSNPTFGSGLVLGAGYLFDTDEGSDTSWFGVGGLRTDNGTEGYAVAGNFSIRNNRLKFGVTAGTTDAFYPLYLAGIPIQIKQTGDLIQGSVAYGFTSHFSAGLHMRYIETTISLKGIGSLPLGLLPDANLEIFNFGLTASYDTRDNTIFPTSGFHLAAKTTHGRINGDSRKYDKATVLVDYYVPAPRVEDVIAFRLAGCAASDTAPFFDACALGSSDGFRGYPSTQFIDDNLLSLQAEYRGQISGRFGYALFGGLGVTSSTGKELLDDEAKSALGLGLRVRLSKKFPLDFAVDAAVNQEGAQSTYIYVGQRF